MEEKDFNRLGCWIVILASLILWGLIILFGWGFVQIVQWITSK